MRRLLREPLFHFVVVGAVLFAVAGRFGADARDLDRRIVVSQAVAANLATGFERTWMRPPTPAELRGLVEDFVKEEILYREALALGLERNDIVIRRRLRQKMEFLHADRVDRGEATQAELQAFLDENPERFEVPAVLSFRQVFVDPERTQGPVEARTTDLLQRLRAAPESPGGAQGDPTLLPGALERATPQRVAGQFGPGFFESVAELPTQRWSGPVPSSYGVHLVLVREHRPARHPDLEEVRQAVERELRAKRRSEAEERFYRELRDRYEVTIEAALGEEALEYTDRDE